MAEFTVNTHRQNPYPQYKFIVKWDSRIIPGIYRISGLKRVTETIEYRAGNLSNHTRKGIGLTHFEPICLERGRTHDDAFEVWANQSFNIHNSLGNEAALKNFRKDISIELLNEAGQLVMAFRVYNCWVKEYEALGELDANASCEAVETLILEHEGWERDHSISEPSEPSFSGKSASAKKSSSQTKREMKIKKNTRKSPQRAIKK